MKTKEKEHCANFEQEIIKYMVFFGVLIILLEFLFIFFIYFELTKKWPKSVFSVKLQSQR